MIFAQSTFMIMLVHNTFSRHLWNRFAIPSLLVQQTLNIARLRKIRLVYNMEP